MSAVDLRSRSSVVIRSVLSRESGAWRQWRLLLECGHRVFRAGRDMPKPKEGKRAICPACTMAAALEAQRHRLEARGLA